MRADTTLKFDCPELNAIRDVWAEKAEAGGGLPSRADFDARTLKPFLRNVSIVERATHPSGRPSYRFASTAARWRSASASRPGSSSKCRFRRTG
ncbi:MAG: hypothetical protein WDM81_21870 [Rhizomicrobium sp.]